MKEKIKQFYEEHEDTINMFGMVAGMSAISYGLLVPFLLICKKLGLTYGNN